MKDILEYTDYRQYIADYYADRKAKSVFSWQEFATAAGFSSPVYLKYVSEGRFNLSEEAAVRMARSMHLAEFECDFFVEMVKFDHAKNDAEKRAAVSKMVSIADAHKSKILEGESFRFFEDWKNPVLRELAPAMPGAKPLALAHACRPEVTAAEVAESLNFLVKADLLKKDKDGNYAQFVDCIIKWANLLSMPLKTFRKMNAISRALRLVSRVELTMKSCRKLPSSVKKSSRLRRVNLQQTRSIV